MQRVRLLGVMLALSLFLSVAGAVERDHASAQQPDPVLFNALYFPWVPNGGDISGTGPWYGTITLQNIDPDLTDTGVRFWVFDGYTINRIALNSDGDGGGYSLADALSDPDVPWFDLDSNASVTLSPGLLDLPEPGSPVIVYALYKGALDHPALFTGRTPSIAGVQKQAAAQPMSGASTNSAHLTIDGYAAIPLPDMAWGSQSTFCQQLRDGVDSCDGTGLHDNDSGSSFDGHSYLPIVQSNSGWNTEIYLSNLDFTEVSAAQVSVTLTESGSAGAAASGDFKATETVNVPPGGTVIIDTRQLAGEHFVGSARITSTVGIGAVAMRSKPADDMLMINASAPSLFATTGEDIPHAPLELESATGGDYRLYAPLVFRDYNGWNTGISFANISEERNRISVSFIDAGGNVVSGDVRNVPAEGQDFIYMPASQDLDTSYGFIGAAVFQADQPFHVVVDQVKYSTGEAMSYLATAVGAGVGETLSMPLVQKGMVDGSGDTSGLQVFNPDFSSSVTIELQFYDSAGVLVRPTHLTPMRTTIGPREIATFYTMNISGMPQNQRSSAVIVPVDGDGSIVGVSNNVNYSVGGDGSVAFNLVNQHGQFRYPVEGGNDE